MIHPDDVLLFEEVRAAMFRVAKKYDLKLSSVTPTSKPEHATANLGTCWPSSGAVQLTMRGMDEGIWAREPRRATDVWDTAAHELAHLRYPNHGPAFQEFEEEMQEAIGNQTEDHREKVLRRLVKMQACRDGEAKLGNTEAAESFAAAINRMMLEYELKPTDLDYQRAQQDDPVIQLQVDHEKHGLERKRARIAWEETLARVVAKAHLCAFLIREGSNNIWFVGTRSHATVAEYVYATLVRDAERLATKEYGVYFRRCRDEGDVTRARGFRSAWLSAFVGRVDERLRAERDAAVREADEAFRREHPDVPGTQSVSLIRIDKALVKVQEYMDGRFKKKRRYASALNGGRDYHADGRAWGRAAADRMPIGRRGVASGADRRKLTA